MSDELKPSPEAVLTKLTDDHGYTVYHDPEDDELTITQTRFYEVQYGDLNFAVSVSELNEPNQWNDAAMDGFCAHFEATLVIDRALRSHSTDGLRIPPVDAVCDDVDRPLRPATMPGDVVERAAQALAAERFARRNPYRQCEAHNWPADANDLDDAAAALTAMQPALQAAVEALDAVMTYGDRAAVNIARSALTTLRTVTEQGEG